MEAQMLMWIHQYATPAGDAVFAFSNILGVFWFCATLVTALTTWHLLRREWPEAVVWPSVGVTILLLRSVISIAVARPRPDLWPHGTINTFSFPSGHALASAAFFPLLGWVLLRGRGDRAKLGYALGWLLAIFVGVGRLYRGVHWPTDVLAGWVLGAILNLIAIRWLRRRSPETGALDA